MHTWNATAWKPVSSGSVSSAKQTLSLRQPLPFSPDTDTLHTPLHTEFFSTVIPKHEIINQSHNCPWNELKKEDFFSYTCTPGTAIILTLSTNFSFRSVKCLQKESIVLFRRQVRSKNWHQHCGAPSSKRCELFSRWCLQRLWSS